MTGHGIQGVKLQSARTLCISLTRDGQISTTALPSAEELSLGTSILGSKANVRTLSVLPEALRNMRELLSDAAAVSLPEAVQGLSIRFCATAGMLVSPCCWLVPELPCRCSSWC